MERKVKVIPPLIRFSKRVAIYCRISTNSPEQLKSLTNQISYLTSLVARKVDWYLMDIYIDIKSGGDISDRLEFQRMMQDCQDGKFDIIVVKSISRFGRNTAVTLDAINKLRDLNVDIYFENEDIHTADGKNTMVLTMIEAAAQEESSNKSINIRWGITRKVEKGESQLYRRKCYGYYQAKDGNLQINEDEAKIVRSVFDMYLQGLSIIGIVREIEKQGVKSPSGKDTWCKRSIETMLSNEKYTGDVIVFKTFSSGFPKPKRITNTGEKNKYLSANINPAIISKEQFEKVQEEKSRRSNITDGDNGIARKSSRYSAKRDKVN
jgi:DNA invertase Pin-like site-specific DNA recombinase